MGLPGLLAGNVGSYLLLNRVQNQGDTIFTVYNCILYRLDANS